MKITVLDGYTLNPGDLSWYSLRKLGDVSVYDRTSPEDLAERIKDSEIVLTNKTILDGATIASLPKLKYIGVLATGYNVVDIEAAHNRGITVTNIPAYSTPSVAQRVFALLLAVTDRVEHYAISNRNGAWTSSKDFAWWDTPLVEIAGKNFGIIGYGNIGGSVAKIALAFGMNVLVLTSKSQEKLPPGIKKVDKEILFQESDIISLHCPLTADTREIINKTSIAKMKRGVILINTGRGLLVNEQDIADALNKGEIGAYCADVLSLEPPAATNPILRANNSYITPHTAWATKESRMRLMDIAIYNLKSWLTGEPQNEV